MKFTPSMAADALARTGYSPGKNPESHRRRSATPSDPNAYLKHGIHASFHASQARQFTTQQQFHESMGNQAMAKKYKKLAAYHANKAAGHRIIGRST